MVDVYLNEKFVGSIDDAQIFLNKVKTARRFGKISRFAGANL